MYLPLRFTGSGQSIEQQLNECCIRRILSKDDTLRDDLGRRIAELEMQVTGLAQSIGEELFRSQVSQLTARAQS